MGSQIFGFRDVVDSCNLLEMESLGEPFTWNNIRHGYEQIHQRLDRFLCNNASMDLFPKYQINNLQWARSDHRAIECCLNGNIEGGQKAKLVKPFRFEEVWTGHPECGELIASGGRWADWEMETQSLNAHLNGSEAALKKWGREVNKKMFNHISILKLTLKEEYEWPYPLDFVKISAIEMELDKYLEDEEIYWKQRSRENWLKWGDKNTKWFHKQATMRRKKNYIGGIINQSGRWTEDEGE